MPKKTPAQLYVEKMVMPLLDEETRKLIGLAQCDLYAGTGAFDEEDWRVYRGFVSACKAIREALDEFRDVAVDEDGNPVDEEAYDAEEIPYVVLDASEVRRAVVGRELAEYV